MGSITLNIKQWGNSLGVRLPAAVAKEVGLGVNQRVEMVVKGQSVVITPARDVAPTLEERLDRFDRKKHGGEEMVAHHPLGAETW